MRDELIGRCVRVGIGGLLEFFLDAVAAVACSWIKDYTLGTVKERWEGS